MTKPNLLQAMISAKVLVRSSMLVVTAACLCILLTASASAQTPRPTPRPAEKPKPLVLPDATVVDQDGKTIRFYSDLVKGKTVVITLLYTSCTTSCPLVGRNMSQLQDLLGTKLGKDVHLISISSDPLVDTPVKLKDFGTKYNRKNGWTLVTGSKAEIDKLLLTLQQSKARDGKHAGYVIMGNDKTGVWKDAYVLSRPASIAKTLLSM